VAAISVLVVDDSVVIRRLVSTVLDEDRDIEVVGTAANGRIGLGKIPQVAPDLVTLDIEMPVLDGLGTLRELRRLHPTLPVIMFSTLTERAASATLEALALGANDYVAKPANVGSVQAGMDSIRTQLIPKIKALRADLLPRTRVTPSDPLLRVPTARPGPLIPPEILAIGSSTGGPDALAEVLTRLPADFPLPVVVVQHMPPVFTKLFAQRLDGKCSLDVREAQSGDVVRPGQVLVAPGGHHMTLRRQGDVVRVLLDQGTPENFCRPAVDPLFRSVGDLYGGRTLALVLTGMGQDGLRGCDRVHAAGGQVVVQDERTSVVWGMPGAVAGAGLAHRVLPLRDIAPDILATVSRSRTPSLTRRQPSDDHHRARLPLHQ
jgi:two-component system, chemotaxis family, protein-glutamate methylesterase/glutaminase